MATTVFTNLYSENLFGCLDDFGICVYGFFCTPCLVGQSVQDAGQGKCDEVAYTICVCYLVPYCGPFLAMQRAGEAINKVRSQPFATSRLLETFLNSSSAASLASRRLIELNLVDFDTPNAQIPFPRHIFRLHEHMASLTTCHVAQPPSFVVPVLPAVFSAR